MKQVQLQMNHFHLFYEQPRSTSNQRNSLPSRENTLTTTSSKKQKVSHTNPINGPLKGKGRPRFGRYSTIVHYSHRCDVCGQHFQALSKIRSVALTHHLRQCRGSLPPDIEMIETADIADELDDFDDVVDARFGHISELEVDMFLIAAKKKAAESSDDEDDNKDEEWEQETEYPFNGSFTAARSD